VSDDRFPFHNDMKRIRLIGIDDSLRRIVEESEDAFSKAYGASMGECAAVVREVVSQTLSMPPEPHVGSQIRMPSFASVSSTMSITSPFLHAPRFLLTKSV